MQPATERRWETLDPQDWDAFRRLAHQMVDETLDHLAGLHEVPAWRPMPAEVRDSFTEPVPWEGIGEADAYRQFRSRVQPYPNGNFHPRYFGWVQGNGTPLAMMADMLAAGLNAHLAGFNQAPALVEQQVIAWMAELLGFPSDASGVFVAGGTMANLLGLAVARHAKAGFDIREQGLQGEHPAMTLYGSTETHGWARKAAEVLGLGSAAFRTVPVDSDFRMDLSALARAVADDRRGGRRPFCVIGTAGTVNTGATDDLAALADFCGREDLWFHVDGAFGALARLSPRLRAIVKGLERADSVGFDLHKWMYQPFECACVLVRDARAHRDAFASAPTYLAEMKRGVIAGGLPFADRGIDLTRSFKALKAWMSLKAYGVTKFVRLIEQNVEQAHELGRLVDAQPDLELLTPVTLNIVCFRFVGEARREAPPNGKVTLNAWNEELLLRLQESGVAVPSSTILDGKFALRAAIVNHRTRWEDLETLVAATARIGNQIAAERL